MSAATVTTPTPSTPPGPTAATAQAPNSDGAAARLTLRALTASLLGALPLLQLLTDASWLVQAWISMAIVIVPAALLRLRLTPSVLHLMPGLVLLVGYLTRVYLSGHAWFGVVPTRRSWGDFRALSSAVGSTIRDSSAPLHSTPPVRLYISLGLVLLAIVLDGLVVIMHRPALAGVPLLLVFTLAGAVPRDPVSWVWFMLAGAGYLLILSSRSTHELTSWGRIVTRPERAVRSRFSTALSGRRIGVVAIAIAVLVPFVLPLASVNLLANALHNGRVGTSGNGKGSTGVVIDPLATLRGELIRSTPVNLFSVTVTGAAAKNAFYLRSAVLENYNGKAWVQGQAQQLVPATGPLSEDPAVLGPAVAANAFKATVTVNHLAGTPPVFATPTALTNPASNWAWNTRYGVVSGSVKAGQVYSETVSQLAPSTETLEASPTVARAGFGAGSSVLQNDLAINDVPLVVSNLVASITAGKATPYDKARALSTYFTDPANGFIYSLATKGGESGSDLVDFLTTGKAGFCQQYAAALGVMLRVANIPARVVLGYSHAAPNAAGLFEVTSDDAHAWVEAYFQGVGWVPFDPTPLTGADAGRAVALPWAPHPATPVVANGADPKNAGLNPEADLGGIPGATADSSLTANHSDGSRWVWLGLIIGAVVILLGLLTPGLLRIRRRRRRLEFSRDHGPEPLWSELAETTRDLRLGWSNARSVRQVTAWLSELLPGDDARSALRRLADAIERRRYSGMEETDTAGSGVPSQLIGALELVRRELLQGATTRARWRARLRPASLLRAREDGIAEADASGRSKQTAGLRN